MSRKLFKPLIAVVILLALLVGGSFLLVPNLVKSQAKEWVAENLPGKQLVLGEVSFNPFKLALTLQGVAISDMKSPKTPLVAIEQIDLNASIASLFTLTPRFDSVVVTGPTVEAVLRRDGSLNLIELVPADDGTPMPEVHIASLTLERGAVDFTDERHQVPHKVRLRPIRFNLADFSTVAGEDGSFRLAGSSALDERFTFAGRLRLTPLGSEGKLTLTDLQLATVRRLLGDAVPLEKASGRLSLAGDYRFSTPTDPEAPIELTANLDTLALRDVAVSSVDGTVELASLDLEKAQYSLDRDSVVLGPVRMAGLSARLGKERVALESLSLQSTDLIIGLQKLALGALSISAISVSGSGAPPVTLAKFDLPKVEVDGVAHTAALGAVALDGLRVQPRLDKNFQPSVPGLWPRPAAPTIEGPAWRTSLEGLQMSDARIALQTSGPRLAVAVPRLTLGPLDADLANATPVALEMTVNDKARLSARGSVTPARAAADLAVELTRLDLPTLAALAPALPVKLVSGTIGAKGQLRLDDAAPDFVGSARLTGLDISQPRPGQDPANLVRLAALDATGIKASMKRVEIKRLSFDRLEAQARLGPDNKFNLVALTDEELVPDAPAPARDAAKRSSASAMPTVRIHEVRFVRSKVGFEDQAIQPNFAVQIEGLEGKISNIDSVPGRLASITLKGYIVDRYSPVTISGTGNLFDYAASTDVTAKFENIELPVFNPYSGRFAGYSIARGKLTTTLHYRINDRALQADHNVRIDQLQWGEATDSKDKVSLPVRLATSLLKDRNGVISLDLPVGGSVDDPTFRIWPVVWQIVGNLMTKLITAPFALLGSMFGGDAEKAQFVAFPPGSAELSPESAGSLAALAKGLGEKPELSLDIPAGPAIAEDAEALAMTRLHAAALQTVKASDWAALDEGKQYDALRRVYKARFGKGADFPDGVKKEAERIMWLQTELAPRFAPTPLELATLGQARANVVKEALLAGASAEGPAAPAAGDASAAPATEVAGLDASRIFLTTASSVTLREGVPTLQLQVK
jgi:hypothetical protein